MRTTLIYLFLFLALVGQAQDKNLSMQEAIMGYHLYPQGLNQLQWLPGGESFSHVVSQDGNTYLMVFEMEETQNGRSIQIDLATLNQALKKAKKDTLNRLPYALWINDKEFGFKNGSEFLRYHIETGVVNKNFSIHEKAHSIEYHPGYEAYTGILEKGFAYQSGSNFGYLESQNKGIVVGQAVHRFEFGITKGLFYSHDATKLAYYHKNETMVSEYPLYNLSTTPAHAEMIRYPTAGKASHEVTLRVKTIGAGTEDVVLNVEGPKDQYLTNVAWTPDDQYILIAVVNREQNHMWLNQYDASTGDLVKTLFEETHDKYVEPEHPAIFSDRRPGQFVWWSERDGYNHLYLYHMDGKLDKQLTKGDWVVTDFHGFSSDGKKIFVTGTAESPTERHLYCVDIKSGKMKRLTTGSGVHSISANSPNTQFIDVFSSPDVPRETRILDDKGTVVQVMHKADNPLADYKLGEMELGVLKGNGGHDLHYRVFKPVDFDPNKKYPVVVYLYNGPHLQLITKRWQGGANLWYQYMAQNGYVVFSLDGRGSANRGLEFENAVFRDLATKEMEDQLTGVNWLKSQAWVDSNRMGIHGWSYGGFMTINMMTRQPGVFKAGVAGGPVIDWSHYEVMYTERYMDTPEENPDGYKKTDLKNYISDLEGDLLVIHGGQDDVVLWEHSLEYIEASHQIGCAIGLLCLSAPQTQCGGT